VIVTAPVLTVGDSDGAGLMEGDLVGDGVAPLPLPLLFEDFELLDFLVLDFFDLAGLTDLADFLAFEFSDFFPLPFDFSDLFFLEVFKIRPSSGRRLSTESVFAR